MSGTDHAPSDEHDADQHDDHDDHVEAPPPEPASPGWLPLLGAGLFLGGLLWFLMSSSPEHVDGDAHAEADAPAAKPAAAEPAAARAIRPQIAPGNKLPEPGTAAPARPDPNKLKEALAVGAGRKPAVAAPPPPPPAPPPPPPPPAAPHP